MVESPFVPYPDLEIVVADSTLPLEAVEALANRYTPTTGADVRLTLRWSGPAAGGRGCGTGGRGRVWASDYLSLPPSLSVLGV